MNNNVLTCKFYYKNVNYKVLVYVLKYVKPMWIYNEILHANYVVLCWDKVCIYIYIYAKLCFSK